MFVVLFFLFFLHFQIGQLSCYILKTMCIFAYYNKGSEVNLSLEIARRLKRRNSILFYFDFCFWNVWRKEEAHLGIVCQGPLHFSYFGCISFALSLFGPKRQNNVHLSKLICTNLEMLLCNVLLSRILQLKF